jgi:protein-S-isoprenylcysteine O-methyltransferase Ste14
VHVKRAGRLRQRHGLIVKGKRISCPPPHPLLIRVALPVQEYHYEHGFPLIRSLRASTQRSTSVLFSFVLSLLIVAGSFAVRQSKTILARSCEAEKAVSIWQ